VHGTPRRSALAGALSVALALPVPSAAQVRAPWFGTWKLNLEKSTYNPGPAPFRRGTCTIELWEDGSTGLKDGVKVTYDLVRARGGITHFEWVGRFDGRDYGLQGVEDYAVTVAYRRIDERTFQVVQKADGGAVVAATLTISLDGRTLTMISSGSTVLYDKQ